MVALYKVKFIDTYCSYPVYFYFRNLDNIQPHLKRIYPLKRIELNDTYFIRVIYVEPDSPELIEVLD